MQSRSISVLRNFSGAARVAPVLENEQKMFVTYARCVHCNKEERAMGVDVPRLPDGWHRLDNCDLCGIECMLAYAQKIFDREKERLARCAKRDAELEADFKHANIDASNPNAVTAFTADPKDFPHTAKSIVTRVPIDELMRGGPQ